VSRRRRAPLVLLLVVAAVPAVALAVTWQWTAELAEPAPTTTTTPPTTLPAGPELSTPLLAFRRAPAPIAERAAWSAYERRVAELLATTGPASCAAVSVDGRSAGVANPGLALVPASNQKLLVAAVALDVIGETTRFRTEVRGAPIVDGVLAGDLFLVGGGDPLLASSDVVDDRPEPAFGTTPFESLADQLVAAGLTRVEGDIVGDGSRYDDEFVVPEWGPDITRSDGGPIDALLVNDGRIVGVGVGLNPNQSAANELNRLLTARGVQIAGRNRADVAPASGVGVLAAVESEPLGTVIDELLWTSDNNTAEMLLKEIGVAGTGVGSRATGIDVATRRLGEWGVPLDGVVINDGSGLSRVNRLTCPALVAILERGEQLGLDDHLPVAGRDGTLADELVGTPADGVVRAKTGTLTDVKALSGVFPDDSGAVLRFSVISNEPAADDPAVYGPSWGQLVGVLDEYPLGPDVTQLSPR
jgi:D-alanyl-D-alanine carboxypeptidase/D-alanyl-D-alanine-endopeptidase (penicillin-binding protein 4)